MKLGSSAIDVLTMNATTGSIVDLSVSFTLSNTFVADAQSISSGTVGDVLYGFLDSGQTVLEPIGVPF
jgi:hypothetical protein